MSAMSSPAPVRAPENPTPVVAPAHHPQKRRRWIGWLIALVIIAGAAAAARYFTRPVKPAVSIASVKTAKAFVAPLEISLRLTGTTSARVFANITAPMLRGPGFGGAGLVLLELAKSGSTVKKDEVVARIDAQQLQDRIDDQRDQVNGAANDVEKRESEQKVEWENMQQTLRVAKANYDKARLDYSAGEVKTDVERELLKLSMDEAEATYKQQSRDVDFRKVSQGAELKVMRISWDLQNRRINHFADNLKRFTVKTPMAGLVTMSSTFRGGEMGQIQLGDQVASGQQIMKVVDPGTMQAEGSVSQSDSGQLRVGQKVRVGFDAFPDMKFPGKVYSIGALAVSGWRQNDYIRTVPVRVAIEGVDPRLIPDLSAYCEIVLRTVPDQLQVPGGALSIEGDKTFVHLKKGEQFEKREVKIGERNNTNVAIVSGLSAGDIIRIN
jgi:multidrug efflux pump subunit AcrA (membrane-fusion protein)